MTPANTALLLIEYQNDFVSEGGAQHAAVADVMRDTEMLAHSQAVAAAARERGVAVLHAPISFAEGYPEIAVEPYGILAGIKQAQAFRKGSWGVEIADAMAPATGDIVVAGKRGLDCFATTNLDFILRQRGITDLAIAGFLTNCCVESTMRSAYERGYRVVTLTDCTATLSADAQQASIANTFPMFSRPMGHAAFLSELETTA
jgi:nicotinamidase-related amidase